MSDAEFTVRFIGTPPDPIHVGDVLRLEGDVTVHSISADLIDITALGSKVQYAPGHVTIDVYSNDLRVRSV
jgi:hypothetical protein